MRTKICVGAIIYNSVNEIFLMTSPKWKGYVVPGGEVEEGETFEQALHREIKEELSIEITDINLVGKKFKEPSDDFKDKELRFHFIDFFARALSTDVVHNEEVTKFGWFSVEEALQLPLLDSTREFVEQFKQHKL